MPQTFTNNSMKASNGRKNNVSCLTKSSTMASKKVFPSIIKMVSVYLCCVFLFSLPSLSEAKRKAIEEIPRRQLDTLITTEDYLAVFWRKLTNIFLTVPKPMN